jgi:CelD/BcsL family acetyltransferase involved in cellulose biosynthesis
MVSSGGHEPQLSAATSVEAVSDVDGIAPEWDALADRVSASPFMRPGWFAAWDRAFGPDPLEVLVARRDGSAVGVLPITSRRGIVRSPTNWHTPRFGALVADEEAADQLATEVLQRTRRWFDFSFVPSADPLPTALAKLDIGTFDRVVTSSPYLNIEGEWEAFVERTLSKRRRSTLRRFARRLADRGQVEFELVDAPPDLTVALDEGFAIEGSGWKTEAGTAILSREDTTRFYREIADWAAGRGELRLWFLRVGGAPVSFAYCLESGGVVYELKTGFDPEYRSFGPGVLLTQERLRYCFETGVTRYEFLGGAFDHKLEWTHNERALFRIQGFRRTPGGIAGAAAWKYGRPMARRVIGLRDRLGGRQG